MPRISLFKFLRSTFALIAVSMLIATTFAAAQSADEATRTKSQSPVIVKPATMNKMATVEERYQSYNLEMIEVMGGSWWAPYSHDPSETAVPPNGQAVAKTAVEAAPHRYQPPINLANPRLRVLAAALSPAYIRLSDTWANTMYFQDSAATEPAPAPPGFGLVLTGPQWKGVIDLSNAINASIVTSFSIGAGTRDAIGLWTPVEAEKFLNFTRANGGHIAAVEFFNEPNLSVIGGAPKGYDAAAYGRDFKIFRAFLQKSDPTIKLLGPGPVGEGRMIAHMPPSLRTEDMLREEGPGLDAVSYHFYGAVSKRCTAMGPALQTTTDAALTRDWLFATVMDADFYGHLRDRFEPGKPLWLTETAEAACGGNPWAASFIDTFRYLNQLGILAQRGVKVDMHNTLTGSDYGLIDRDTVTPRPNYWAAVLWRRLMGTTVLDSGQPVTPNLYLYAHCLAGHPGGVALLAINADRTTTQELKLPTDSLRYTLTAKELLANQVQLNGINLVLNEDGDLPDFQGAHQARGPVSLAPASITFLAIPGANNQSCHSIQ